MIEARNLTHAYRPGAPVLRDVSFRVAEGESAVLLGSNGCGKTTLLRILAGLVRPDAGEVRWRGETVDRAALRRSEWRVRFRREVGLLFQNAGAMLFHATVREEIAFGPRQIETDDALAVARAELWAERFGVADRLEAAPHRLSAGEQKRVALACVLATEPSVLLLDEPTAGLDPRSTGRLIDFLQDEPRTLVIATHNLGLAREMGDRALVLSEDHRLIHDGDFESLGTDREKLLAANLLHIHRHRHDGEEHRHWHEHRWD
jgi:cobalt/nickel transport system ATP-binding protein